MDETLRFIQLCQLDILREVVRICNKNNIKYYLAWGTMLGAVRHKGFIPWDDDLDIYMPLEDLKNFEKCCLDDLQSDYFLQCPKTEPFMGWLYYKVRRNNTCMKESSMENDNRIKNHGVWIDIFPLINYSNDENLREKQVDLLKQIQKVRFEYINPELASWRGKIVILLQNRVVSIRDKKMWKQLLDLGNNNSDYFLSLGNAFFEGMEKDIPKSCYEKTLFDKTQKYEFEGDFFIGVLDYDSYLTQVYGRDYMVPKRFNQHVQDYSRVDLKGFLNHK